MSMTWRPLTYLGPFPIDFSCIDMKRVPYVFENMTYPIAGFGSVIHAFNYLDDLAVVLPLVVFFFSVDGVSMAQNQVETIFLQV